MGVKKGNIQQYKSQINHAVKYVIPCFERTYLATIETLPNGEMILKCRGGQKNSFPCHWCKHGRACEHMFRLLGRSPTKQDALPRWHVDYLHFYGRDTIITEHYIKLRDEVRMQGVPLTEPEVYHIKSLLSVREGTQEKSFFTNSLDTLRLSGKGTYWHKIRDRLPPHLQQFIPEEGEDTMSQEEEEISLASDGKNYEGKIGNPDDLVGCAESMTATGQGGNEIFTKAVIIWCPCR